MKKLLVILALFFFTSGSGIADVEKVIKEIKKNKDIAMGFKKVIDRGEDNKKNNWRVTNKKILDTDKNTRKHVVKIVNKSDNHPVRFGKQSLRFEVRNGDGWGWDARNNRERVELLNMLCKRQNHMVCMVSIFTTRLRDNFSCQNNVSSISQRW